MNEPNMEVFCATLIKILERKYDVKIKYTLRKKTEEELQSGDNRLMVFDNCIFK